MTPDIIELKAPDRTLDVAGSQTENLFPFFEMSIRSDPKLLDDAVEENPHVSPYLTGEKRVPNRRPDVMGWGDEREAIWYVSEHLNYWRRTPGAVGWLAEQLKARPASKKSKPRTPRRGKSKGRKR